MKGTVRVWLSAAAMAALLAGCGSDEPGLEQQGVEDGGAVYTESEGSQPYEQAPFDPPALWHYMDHSDEAVEGRNEVIERFQSVGVIGEVHMSADASRMAAEVGEQWSRVSAEARRTIGQTLVEIGLGDDLDVSGVHFVDAEGNDRAIFVLPREEFSGYLVEEQ